ncbi:hypothetical protein BH747_12085 [Enterococcus villorum]|uniref:Uncharacterized protein n=1 Tax=Enterococcus villorum TaxID=112904 RepID=A0A1V8YP30_9ENTE|nr:hypothetical protein [Enterococcus villorum]OQO68412.1 hypothetical protein BH747_12085 [Enterococcus villorum]OQO74359.1 hypothetical protein BH744_07435 [Enterococcus villorum]
MNREERCKFANELIEIIASCGREFLNYKNRINYEGKQGIISHFKLKNGRVYFVDGYVQKDIYAYGYRYFRRKFSEGGTVKALILDLAEYIRTGKSANATHGYGGGYCQHWGYPEEDMKIIQNKAVEIGFSKSLPDDTEDYI